MKTYSILRDFRFKGVTYRKSKTETPNTIELNEAEAEPLVKLRFIKEIKSN